MTTRLQTGDVAPEARRSLSGPLAKAPQGQDWTPKVGFARSDLRAGVLIDDPENRALVLHLSPDVIPGIGPTLLANGYAMTAEKGFPAYWRGLDDLSFDPALRSKDDPFTYPLPISSRIALDGAEGLTPFELLQRYFMSKNTPEERAGELADLAKAIFTE